MKRTKCLCRGVAIKAMFEMKQSWEPEHTALLFRSSFRAESFNGKVLFGWTQISKRLAEAWIIQACMKSFLKRKKKPARIIKKKSSNICISLRGQYKQQDLKQIYRCTLFRQGECSLNARCFCGSWACTEVEVCKTDVSDKVRVVTTPTV